MLRRFVRLLEAKSVQDIFEASGLAGIFARLTRTRLGTYTHGY
jgi:hypothetical protein